MTKSAKPIAKLIVFRSPLGHDTGVNEWRFCCADAKAFSWPVFNPSGESYVDGQYVGMGETRTITITLAQAAGDKRQTLINCALYSARTILPKHGEVPTGATIVEVAA